MNLMITATNARNHFFKEYDHARTLIFYGNYISTNGQSRLDRSQLLVSKVCYYGQLLLNTVPMTMTIAMLSPFCPISVVWVIGASLALVAVSHVKRSPQKYESLLDERSKVAQCPGFLSLSGKVLWISESVLKTAFFCTILYYSCVFSPFLAPIISTSTILFFVVYLSNSYKIGAMSEIKNFRQMSVPQRGV